MFLGVIGIFVAITIGYFTLIKKDFSIFMNSYEETSVLGDHLSIKITIKSTRYRHPIRLRRDLRSNDIAVNFSPQTVTPSRNRFLFFKATCESTMTIAANNTTPGNRYTIPIIATDDDGSEKRNVFSLICLNQEEPVSI